MENFKEFAEIIIKEKWKDKNFDKEELEKLKSSFLFEITDFYSALKYYSNKYTQEIFLNIIILLGFILGINFYKDKDTILYVNLIVFLFYVKTFSSLLLSESIILRMIFKTKEVRNNFFINLKKFIQELKNIDSNIVKRNKIIFLLYFTNSFVLIFFYPFTGTLLLIYYFIIIEILVENFFD